MSSQLNLTTATLICAAFDVARHQHPELDRRWVDVSFSVGGLLGASTLMMSVQRDGKIDLLLRAMEDEAAAHMKAGTEGHMMALHCQKMLSDLWIGSVYETMRLLAERKLAPETEEYKSLAYAFRLIRIPLEKHEIARDNKIKEPLKMQRYPSNGDDTDYYTYPAGGDPLRAHIMPSGVSERGSLMWQALDGATLKPTWFERRNLSERFLALWPPRSGSQRCELAGRAQ